MPWRPGRNGTICRRCGGHVSEVGQLSARGRCEACGREWLERNSDELRAHAGPFFTHWRRQTAASVGAILLDDAERDD